MSATTRAVAEIQVGTRHRRELGDIDALAQNIADVGLLHPIVVTPAGQLIAGARRLHAWRKLGHERIPVTIVDLEQIVRGEYAENFLRKAFTPSEYVAIADELEPLERQAAKERQGQRTDKLPGNFPGSRGRALDHIGRVVGKDRKTIAKAREVRDAALAEPERFGKLAADMDRTGRVNGPYKRLNIARRAEAIRAEPPPYPERGPYRVGTVDVPWPYDLDRDDPADRATYSFPQMSIDAICAMGPKVRAIMHEDCIVWFWVTNFHLLSSDAFTVLDAWGLQRKALLTWVKTDHIGRGEWLRGQSEQCIMAVRGAPVVDLTNQTTVLYAPVPRDASGRPIHSAKPPEFYAFVERLCPAPRYAELFQRTARKGWDGHGDEVSRQAEATR